MSVNDPIGDMIARIKNAAMRKRSKVSTPASRMRGRVLDVLQSEGYIRGYALVEHLDKHPEFEIELKYFDADQKRPGHLDPVDAQGRHVRRSRPRPQCRRRSALPGLLGQGEGTETCHGSARRPSRSRPA